MRFGRIAAEHRAEGEPKTRARIDGMAHERFGQRCVTWVSSDGLKHVAAGVFTSFRVEGIGSNWLDAMDDAATQLNDQKFKLKVKTRP